MNRIVLFAALTFPFLLQTKGARFQENESRGEVLQAIRKATHFLRTQVATEGGYLWRYSEDLSKREGERRATATMVWVQPPGTPSVGNVYLLAYEVTKDSYYLEGAKETAYALVNGQLRSGGWDYHIDFDPEQRKLYAYRVGGHQQGRNATTLDDNTTQAAVRLLMRVDRAVSFRDEQVHEAALYALNALLGAQYPNGAWPQRYDRFPDPEKFAVKKAGYPPAWSRTWPNADYRGYYTFNDNTLSDMIETMLEASQTYGEPKYKQAAEKAGDCILLTQMPEPQPAWAQQYDVNIHPAWARKFEPPAISGGESHGVLRTLLLLYRETGNRKYLTPLPRALKYFRRSRLPDGRLARFYELQTNRPLYFTRDYQLTYSDEDVPTHYAFKVENRIEEIAKEYELLKKLGSAELKGLQGSLRPKPSVEQVRDIVSGLDAQGRWVEEGRLRNHGPEGGATRIIETRTFIENLTTLCAYLGTTR